MGEKCTLLLIQYLNGLHIPIIQHKVKYIQVLFHAFPVDGLGDYHHIPLDQIPQGNLGRCLTMLFPYLIQNRIGEEILAAFGKGPPGFMLHMVPVHNDAGILLLVEHMGFHLVHGRGHLHKPAQVDEAVRIKVGYSDCPDISCPAGFLHGPVCAVIIIKRLMD